MLVEQRIRNLLALSDKTKIGLKDNMVYQVLNINLTKSKRDALFVCLETSHTVVFLSHFYGLCRLCFEIL